MDKSKILAMVLTSDQNIFAERLVEHNQASPMVVFELLDRRRARGRAAVAKWQNFGDFDRYLGGRSFHKIQIPPYKASFSTARTVIFLKLLA